MANEIIAQHKTDSIEIICYNLEKDKAYMSSYMIETLLKHNNVVFYAYFEDIADMFYIYDNLK